MGNIISGITSLIGGNEAASAANKAAGMAQGQIAQTRQDLLPYNTAGESVLPQMTAAATSGINAGGPDFIGQAAAARPPSVFTEQDLQQTPGYQFTQNQGLKSTQSAAAARGLGVSGAALKGAGTYATNLADNTYSNRFNEAQTSFSDLLGLNQAYQSNATNSFNRLLQTSDLGERAAAASGQIGANLMGTAASATAAGGAARAQGLKGFGTGIGNALNQGVGAYGTTQGWYG